MTQDVISHLAKVKLATSTHYVQISALKFTTTFVNTRLWKTNTRGISVSLACYWQIGSKSTNHSPTAWRREGKKVTLVAVIGGFRSDLSITRKTDGNFGNVSVGVLFSKVAYQRKGWQCRFLIWWLIAVNTLPTVSNIREQDQLISPQLAGRSPLKIRASRRNRSVLS